MDLQEMYGELWTGLLWLRVVAGASECCNEAQGSIKFREFLD